MEYHKINSIFKRNMTKKNTPFIVGEYSTPEFEYLQGLEWEWTEKIDGTNIRINWDGNEVTIGGKTEAASIPAHLIAFLNANFHTPEFKDKLIVKFGVNPTLSDFLVTFYGEGFGYKIQTGSHYLGKAVGFYLFDIKIGRWWLKREDVYSMGDFFGMTNAVKVGSGPISEAIELVSGGFKSAFGDAQAEGLVLRPKVELLARSGERIITKIKTRDFK